MPIFIIALLLVCTPAFANSTQRCYQIGSEIRCDTTENGPKFYSRNNSGGDAINYGVNGFIQGMRLRQQRDAQQAQLQMMQQELDSNDQDPEVIQQENPCAPNQLRYTTFNFYNSKNDTSKYTYIVGDDCVGEIITFDAPKESVVDRTYIEEQFSEHRRR